MDMFGNSSIKVSSRDVLGLQGTLPGPAGPSPSCLLKAWF